MTTDRVYGVTLVVVRDHFVVRHSRRRSTRSGRSTDGDRGSRHCSRGGVSSKQRRFVTRNGREVMVG
jgi:hypothetical protein